MNIKNKRQLMWSDKLIDKNEGVEIIMHRPVKQNIALSCDNEWEGSCCGYASTVKIGDEVRLYYRASSGQLKANSSEGLGTICVAISDDGGITFKKPNVGNYEFRGSKENNIVYHDGKYLDNFSVYYDENPDCPEDARFKVLASHGIGDKARLEYYKSSDGFKFEYSHDIDVYGAFDTLNILLWDEKKKVYRVYIRSFHDKDGNDIDVNNGAVRGRSYRDIRWAESADMINWTKPVMLEYTDDDKNLQLYTNGITKYERADIYYGTPSRYYDRSAEMHNLKYLPTWGGMREEYMKTTEKRTGTAMTDCIIMTSEDGYLFDRSAEAFMTPGPEDEENWVYGDCYPARGMVITPGRYKGVSDELSIYCGKGYRVRPLDFERYTLRLDGIYSWYAKAKGAKVLTKPVTIGGNSLSVNFATSALGHLRIRICDEKGEYIEGYDSYNLFGDSTDRPVDFEKDLSLLEGKTVRLEIDMSDCHLYSFIFE